MAPKKSRGRKRQSKLSFSPAAKVPSPAAAMRTISSKPAMATPTKAPNSAPALHTRPSSSKASKKVAIHSCSEDELQAETDRGMQLGMPMKSTAHGMFGSSDIEQISSDTSEEEEQAEEARVKPLFRKRRRAKVSSESEDAATKVTVIKRKRTQRHSLEAEASEDEELRLPRSKRRKATRRQSTPEEEEQEQTPSRSRRRRTTRRQSASGEDEDEEQTPPRSKQRKASRRQATPSEEEEEPLPPRSKRRRIPKRRATPDEEEDDEDEEQEEDNASGNDDDDGEEKEDLQEDLAFLRSSPLPDRGKLRSAHEKPKNERQKALEALKKRRAGNNELSSSATPGRTRRIVVESESDTELEVIKEEPDSDLEVISDPEEEDEDEQELDRDANALDMFQEDVEDEGFIDDDVNALIGEPILGPEDILPLAFSRLASAKPKELFKYAIEWMVMKKIHPAFDSSNQVYDITFKKLDDEVNGLANSKFSSSVWTPDFTRAIRARPDLMIMEIPRGRKDFMDAYCEACNRKNHPASDEIMLTGMPYDKETLEPLENESDSDSNAGSDDDSELSADSECDLNGEKPTYDATGERLPPESRRFALGSTCSANAQVAHTLHHWPYHLYSWVKGYLARVGHLTAEMLVKRDKWSDRRREKAALKIVNAMEEDGEIRKLYRLYKEQVKYAVEAQNDQRNRRWKG